jgi:hypothetical protein
MCEPEIICDKDDKPEADGVGFQVINVKCKFGFKVDVRGNCRRIL